MGSSLNRMVARRGWGRLWAHGFARGGVRLRALAALLLMVAAFPAALSAQISLSSTVELAERESSTVKIAQADMRKAEALLAESKDVYVPNFIIGSSAGPPSIGFPVANPSIASATMQSLAFSFSQKQFIAAAREGIQAALLNLKDAREQVALDTSTAYIELDGVERELEAAKEQGGYSDRLLAIEQQRSEAGVDSLSDLLQVRLTVAQLRLRRIHLEARASSLVGQLVALTGLPAASILPEHASIPEIPAVHAPQGAVSNAGLEAAQAQARSRLLQAKGDESNSKIRPQIGFGAQYNRDATSLNNYNQYYGHVNPTTGQPERLKADEFSAGFSIQIPLFDLNRRDKARESAAEALRATVEAEQARRQNDVQVANLAGNLRELDALAEVASLKQEIAVEQLKAVQTQLESGNGAGAEPGAPQQLSPKAEQQARMDERQKYIEALDAALDLTKTRLSLLRVLGHMDDWLHTLGPVPATPAAVVPGNHS